MSDSVKAEVAEYEKLSMVIWYYEELSCDATDAVLTKRLEKGEGKRKENQKKKLCFDQNLQIPSSRTES